jgi:CheY-like chemotaxis protein
MSPLQVLVADDDAIVLKLCTYVLQRAGYRVSIAENGQQVLAQVAVEPPAVIVLDLLMPVLDGLSACQHLRSNPTTAHIPVALMSAHSTLMRPQVDLSCADAVIPKPFDFDQFLHTVAELVTAPVGQRR